MSLGDTALVVAAAIHAPVGDREKKFMGPHTREPTRPLSLLKDCRPRARLRIRQFGHDTLMRDSFEALRLWRQVSLLEKRTTYGSRGKHLAAAHRTRFLQNGLYNWPINNVARGCVTSDYDFP